ncbi:MAG: DUF2293 domain-containing protein [Actinomycetota bacterium]
MTRAEGRPTLSKSKPGALGDRVARVSRELLAQHKYVAPVDLLLGLGWLPPSGLDFWQQGRAPSLEEELRVSPEKIGQAMALFLTWAERGGLQPTETPYVARTRDRRALRFSTSGDEAVERAFRTHWVSPALSEARRQQLTDRQSKPPDLVVIEAIKEWTCASCSETGDLLIMEDGGPLCMTCADLDHLVFLPSGDTALTRRAKKASELSAVVVRFSRARKRYERQGILVEERALEQAEQACFDDAEVRARRRERAEVQRAGVDLTFQAAFAEEIQRQFPNCPSDRAEAIAAHACIRGSGRVGRSAAGRALDAGAVTAAVVASVRHQDTPYDRLLMAGVPRADARARIAGQVDNVLTRWREA